MPKGIRVHSWLTIETGGIIRQLPPDTRTNIQLDFSLIKQEAAVYRGRIAPTPSGWLHLGHASTFEIAWRRAREAKGTILYRTEDLDPARCKDQYETGAIEDLRWWGLDWDGEPVRQRERLSLYREALDKLIALGLAYPSPHSRRQIREAKPKQSPFDGDLIFPTHLRVDVSASKTDCPKPFDREGSIDECNYRFRVPDGKAVTFVDNRTGQHTFVAGRDFGDFVLWKKDNYPAYELAVVVDDHKMGITEVVRGEDLLVSTARQLLIYEALGWSPPEWYHCPLVIDPDTDYRMSKTHESMGLRELRRLGLPPAKEAGFYFSAIRQD